jgi:hypothetical protein
MNATTLRASLACCVTLLPLADRAAAQGSLLHLFTGNQAADRLGWALCGPGDVNGDSVPDVVIGVPFDPVGSVQIGSVQVRSGASGALLYELTGDAALDHAGWALCAMGDLNSDGRGDFAMGLPDSDLWALDAGTVRVISGQGGGTMHQWSSAIAGESFGSALASAGDVNGDGRADVLIGAWRSNALGAATGRAELRSGANGVLIRIHQGGAAGDRFGIAVAGLGDINGDGRSDYAVGADQEGQGPGVVKIFSGANGALLRTHTGPRASMLYGAGLARAGDVNLDGVPDLAIGAPHADNGPSSSAGKVELRSGADGGLLWQAFGQAAGAELGRALSGGADVSGDGRPDVLAGAPLQAGTGVAVVLSGLNGAQLDAFLGQAGGDRQGQAVAWLGDLDGDGRSDPAVGAPREDQTGTDSGAARVYSGEATCGVVVYCTAKVNSQGCLPAMSWSGSPTLTGPDDFVVHATSVLNNKAGVLLYGHQPASFPLFGGTFCIGSPFLRSGLLLSGGNPPPDDCSGKFSLAFGHAFMQTSGWSAGTRVVVQIWSRDPAHPDGTAINLTDALDFLICP